jgi:HlyD family secretion protein
MKALINTKHLAIGAMAVLTLSLAACTPPGSPASDAEELPVVIDDLSVIADGRLTPIKSAQLSFTTGGEIGEVLVEEGDVVAAGQPLVRLTNRAQFEAAVAGANLELVSAQQALDALYENADTMAAQAMQNLANARDELRDANYTWSVQQEGNRASESAINGAEARLHLAKRALDDAKENYDHVSGRRSDDPSRAVAQTNLSNAQQDYDSALRNLNWLTGKPTEIQQAMLDADVAIAEARVMDAERIAADLANGPDPDDIALAEARLVNAQAQLSAAEAAVADLELTAPFDGTVASVASTIGEMAAPGQPAIVLADFSSWMIETDNLTEIELPEVGVGQQVLVNFDALSDVELEGTVTAIKPLFEIRQGDVTYVVTISLDEHDPRLQWGMTAVVTFGDAPLASE